MEKMEHSKANSSEPTNKPHFFKFLFPDPFTKLLNIPNNFYKHLPAVPPKRAALVIQQGKIWEVEVCQINDEDICFGRGWPEFAKAHDLRKGYFVVFRLEGNMGFNVEIFDTTCCIKDYKLTPLEPPPTLKFESSKFVDLTSDVKSTEGGSQVPNYASGEKGKNPSGKKIQLTDNKEDREQRKQTSKSMPQKKEKMKNSSSAKSPIPQFEKILNRYSTTKSRPCLIIPKKFCIENGIVSERTIFLKNYKGKKWPVKFSIRNNIGELSRGWREFSIKNRLNEQDRCIFQLVKRNTFLVINVEKINE